MTLFFATTKALVRRHPSGTLNPLRGKMLFVSFLMFGIATTVCLVHYIHPKTEVDDKTTSM